MKQYTVMVATPSGVVKEPAVASDSRVIADWRLAVADRPDWRLAIDGLVEWRLMIGAVLRRCRPFSRRPPAALTACVHRGDGSVSIAFLSASLCYYALALPRR
jgi:hypothetical protein